MLRNSILYADTKSDESLAQAGQQARHPKCVLGSTLTLYGSPAETHPRAVLASRSNAAASIHLLRPAFERHIRPPSFIQNAAKNAPKKSMLIEP
eukprot:scaffold48_cov311-Pinguiococcus_pyrenoidosus.AAC.338